MKTKILFLSLFTVAAMTLQAAPTNAPTPVNLAVMTGTNGVLTGLSTNFFQVNAEAATAAIPFSSAGTNGLMSTNTFIWLTNNVTSNSVNIASVSNNLITVSNLAMANSNNLVTVSNLAVSGSGGSATNAVSKITVGGTSASNEVTFAFSNVQTNSNTNRLQLNISGQTVTATLFTPTNIPAITQTALDAKISSGGGAGANNIFTTPSVVGGFSFVDPSADVQTNVLFFDNSGKPMVTNTASTNYILWSESTGDFDTYSAAQSATNSGFETRIAAMESSGVSQSPWVGDINANDKKLTNVNEIAFSKTNGTAGKITLYATNGTSFATITAPEAIITNLNIILPDRPNTGLFYGTLSGGTNLTLTQIPNGADGEVLKITGGVPAYAANAGGGAYTLFGQTSLSANPAISTTYYAGASMGNNLRTTATEVEMLIPTTGTITKVVVHYLQGNNSASTENVTFSVEKNNNASESSTWTSSLAGYPSGRLSSGAVSFAVAADDLIALKVVTPAWSAAPTGVFLSYTIYITL